VWILVPRTKEINVIGIKWIFKIKMNEQTIIVRNKDRLVGKGYNQEVELIMIKDILLLVD